MQNDLSHINKQIQQNQVKADDARRNAEAQRLIADQHRQGGESGAPDYYEQQARDLETHADELIAQNEQLQAERERVEARIAELEQQREAASREHTDRLNQIDQELTQLRGSGFML